MRFVKEKAVDQRFHIGSRRKISIETKKVGFKTQLLLNVGDSIKKSRISKSKKII